ncbi:MAG TPA: hypothetical protein VGB73_14325 [Pyrinomonadaceae bacterium]|jgi:hypothetical protein
MNVLSYLVVGSVAGALLFGLAVRFLNLQVSSAAEAVFDSIELALAEREHRRIIYSSETDAAERVVSIIRASSAPVWATQSRDRFAA